MAWTPKILTEFEIGQAMAAIEAVARLEKPLTEVGCRVAKESDIEADLLQCLNDAGESGRVSCWIERRDEHVRYGFYAQPWVLQAMEFLRNATLQPQDRHWITGLLFGYRASAIQRFLEAQSSPELHEREHTSPTLPARMMRTM